MSKTTLIRNIAWAILWDEDSDQHVYGHDIDIVFRDVEIISIVPKYSGEFEEVIEGGSPWKASLDIVEPGSTWVLELINLRII